MILKKNALSCAILILAILVTSPAFPAEDSGWPREFEASGNKILVYQPQVESWKDHSVLKASMAVSVTLKGTKKPVLGALWIEAATDTDFEERTVTISDLKIIDLKCPGAGDKTVDRVKKLVKEILGKRAVTVDLDRVLAAMERSQATAGSVAVSNQPPTIIVSKSPAVLLLFNGDPVLSPIEGTDLHWAVNSNMYVFFQAKTSTYYLLIGDLWLKTTDLKGPWAPVDKLPEGFSSIPDEEQWKPVLEHLKAEKADKSGAPRVFVSTKPAELIVIEGEPQLSPISGTKLLYVKNTKSDLFLYGEDGKYYYLVSGRWFRSAGLDGPWSSVGKDLPADFARIPDGNPKEDVLSSVAGTPQAKAAVAEAQIPRKKRVKRDEAHLDVTYDGDPKFEPITGTRLQYAVNTPFDVVRVGDLYYACFQGVWFVSTTPDGPWVVCDSVPKEIYTIPPQSPLYNVTYVNVYDSTPEDVEVGYTAGYEGTYVSDGVAVYGTGYWYPPYFVPGAWPIYYPRGYLTYGYGVYYNPYTGRYAATHQAGTAYAQWGQSVIGKGDQYIHTGHITTPMGTVAGFETSTGAKGAVAVTPRHHSGAVKTGQGDLYVGRDGNIYKRTDDGWSKYQGHGQWSPVKSPQPQASRITPGAERASKRAAEASQLPRDPRNLRGERPGDRTPPRDLSSSAPRRKQVSTLPAFNDNRSDVVNRLLDESSARRLGDDRARKYRSYQQGSIQNRPRSITPAAARSFQLPASSRQPRFRSPSGPARSFHAPHGGPGARGHRR